MAEKPLSDRAVYRARPTIRVDGEENERASELLIGMQMREAEDGLSAAELRFSNVASDTTGDAALAFEGDDVLRLGATIALYAGDENAPKEIFRGVISGLEAEFREKDPPEIVVLAEDTLQRARMSRRTKTHENVTLADLANNLANDLGLRPVVSGLTDNVGTQVQLNESDLAFVRRLLARYDGDLQVVGDELHAAPRGEVKRGEIELALHSQLRRARVCADLAGQVTEVTVTGWDPIKGERVSASSTGAHKGCGSGRTGAEIIQDAFGGRAHQVGHLAVPTDPEARAVADAAFDERARRFVSVQATADGNPALRVGTHVTLKGLGPRFDNTYYVVRACHRFDVRRGYETDFDAECAFLGTP